METKLLFIEIETHRVKNWCEISPELQHAFEKHLYDPNTYKNVEEHYNEKAALHAEFSHIISISLGYEKDAEFKISTIYGTDETELLTKLAEMLNKFKEFEFNLAGHDINGFDKPFLIKRYIINQLPVPKILNSLNIKPWEAKDVDTKQLWKMGGWQNVSLDTICATLGIPGKTIDTLKYNIDINNLDFEELKTSCENGVKASFEIYKIVAKYLEANKIDVNKTAA